MSGMPVFQIGALANALEDQGFSCRIGSMELDVHPMKRPYFERWLSNRDGFLRFASGNVDFLGVEDVMRMGPFYNVYCLVENNSIVDTDDNAHKLLDAAPYFQLHNGKVTSMGWSGEGRSKKNNSQGGKLLLHHRDPGVGAGRACAGL
ncbi:MAG: hypothetical protein AUH37_00610 [Candidatus Nitrososphaera sp. 13_1_40CM_48_12]|nr:MAG: hypothetical protein AUH37_00610 [Candidatus Nitrososphaera sp. 13_1_40CM_48_12]